MQEFSIRVISKRKIIHGMPAYEGKLVIGDFYEKLIISLNIWKKRDYERQWQSGLERIKHKKRSCLVVSVQNLDKAPLVELWSLYREGDTVFIHNLLFVDTRFKKRLEKRPFNEETCYSFIGPRRTKTADGYQISEWSVPLSAIDTALAEFTK